MNALSVPAESLAPSARPLVKWCGGKTQLLPELLARVPKTFRDYYEPFVGGGALFFALSPILTSPARKAIINDTNAELVNAYRIVRDAPNVLIPTLSDETFYKYDKKRFYEIRSLQPEKMALLERAARLLYLNKTCFNGLYRVNKKGEFNVPFGRYNNPRICDAENLQACSRVLQNARIEGRDFESVLGEAQEDDFAYCDCPYLPISKTSNFVAYAQDGFTLADQQRLRDAAIRAHSRGVQVLLSNADHPLVRELYAHHVFAIERVSARRNVNSKASSRGEVGELLIRTYSL